ncbi:MAG: NAD(P)-binding domain-containing protein [bacterium]|nr:NAD(P)-binding domain-containing protein [bacterium]
MSTPEHHTVIIVGGGPAGLPMAAVLNGWFPYYRSGDLFRSRYAQIDEYLKQASGTLLGLDFPALVQTGIQPVDLFRLLHHPGQKFQGVEEIALEFRKQNAIDCLLITREQVGGLWNNVPKNLFTLSPGQWMEFAFYPLAQHCEEHGIHIDVNDLIIKQNLIHYYHTVPESFGITDRIHTGENVARIKPHEKGFHLTTQDVGTETTHQYTCKYLIYAVGQRCILRELGVPGENLPFVVNHYDKPEDFPDERIAITGGGRSADWAATELHDAGKEVHYIMRQTSERHWRLISESRHGLPYYTRIAQIIESKSPRFHTHYETHTRKFETGTSGGLVTLEHDGQSQILEVDHAILELGGIADYSLFEGFPDLPLVEKYDSYRFQVHQLPTHPHNYESTTIPNLYPGGYLAQGIGLVVIGMHGTTYAIAGDILQKEGLL